MTEPVSPPNPPEASPVPGRPADDRASSRVEQARSLYVSGDAATLAEAASAVGLSNRWIEECAARDGWVEARRLFAERLRASLTAEAAEGEARVQATIRRMSWRVALKAMQRMEKLLDDPAYKVNPFGVEALTRAAMALSGLGDQEADEAVLRMRRKPVREVVREFVKAMQDLGADDAIDVAAPQPSDAALAPPTDPSSPSTTPP